MSQFHIPATPISGPCLRAIEKIAAAINKRGIPLCEQDLVKARRILVPWTDDEIMVINIFYN